MDRLKDAIMLAVTKHNDQLDKAGQLYITHPLRVMDRFLGAPIEYQISAVLHDVIEDTDTTYEDLKEKFGVGYIGDQDYQLVYKQDNLPKTKIENSP